MIAQPIRQQTEKEYLLFEEQSGSRHEYYQGEIFAMAGGSIEHNRIATDTATEIGFRLKGKKCEIFGSDLRIHIETNGLYTYPDLSIVCETLKRYKERTDTITNPVVIMEVLSPTKESYDRGEEFELYRDIPTLREYILIASTRISIDKFTLTASGQWLLTTYKTREESLYIESIDEHISLEEIYQRAALTESYPIHQ